MDNKNTILSVRIDSKKFAHNGTTIEVLKAININISKGEVITILGPSGCGKTTLLRIIGGLEVDYDGSIVINGKHVRDPRGECSIMFQDSRLIPWFSVRHNIELALPKDSVEREKKVNEVLELVKLTSYSDMLPRQLSGGMLRKTAFARAIVNSPVLLLMDEPFSALDMPTRFKLQEELNNIIRRKGISTLLVTHDIDEAITLSDRILVFTGIPASLHSMHDLSGKEQNDKESFKDELRRILLREIINI